MPSAPRFALLLTFCLAGSLSLAQAGQVVLKDGRVLKGQVSVDRSTKRVQIKRGGSTLSFALSEVLSVIEDEGSEPKGSDTASGPKACLIPVHGGFDRLYGAQTFARAVARALRKKPKVLVIEISSPGGRIDVARKLSQTLLAVKGTPTLAWIHGPQRGAFSAAAYLALSCDYIVMGEAQSIGAAVAYQASPKGTPKAVSEKFSSAWRAEFRAVAQAKKHPLPVALAMVDDTPGLAVISLKGKLRLVSATSLAQIKVRASREQSSFRLVSRVCAAGKVLTLTSKEARRVRLAKAVSDDLEVVLKPFKVKAARVERFPDPLALARRTVAKEQKALERESKALYALYAKIQANDPYRFTYPLERGTRAFVDKGAAWRRRCSRCLSLLKSSLRKLKGIEARKKRHVDLDLSQRKVDKLRREFESYQVKLKAERYLKHFPSRRR